MKLSMELLRCEGFEVDTLKNGCRDYGLGAAIGHAVEWVGREKVIPTAYHRGMHDSRRGEGG